MVLSPNTDIVACDGRSPTRKLCKLFELPTSNEHKHYKLLINDMPENDNVALLGLPANIDRTLQRKASQEIIGQLIKLVFHAVTQRQQDIKNLRFEKEKWALDLLPVLNLWKKVIPGSELLEFQIMKSSTSDPISDFFDIVVLFNQRN